MNEILEQLDRVLEDRKSAAPDSSYVAALYAKGPDAVLKKIGEESSEVILAAKSGDRDAIVHEVADLWFHSLILLSQAGLGSREVLAELQRRGGRSGLEEKARRDK